MGLFYKTELRPLAKGLASAWQVHDDWLRSPAVVQSVLSSNDWSSSTWQVGNNCRPSLCHLCHFVPFIMVIVKWCWCESSTPPKKNKYTVLRTKNAKQWNLSSCFPILLRHKSHSNNNSECFEYIDAFITKMDDSRRATIFICTLY